MADALFLRSILKRCFSHMKLFQKYAFKGLLLTTVGVSLILTIILWIAQSLKFIRFFSSSVFSMGNFFLLMISVLPHTFLIVVPFGFLCALFWRYHRLIFGNERIVMDACGVSQKFFVYPSVVLAGMLSVFLFVISMYLGPRMEQVQKETRDVMTYSFAPSLICPGVFSKIGHYMLYVHKQLSSQDFEGILLCDDGETYRQTISGQKARIAPYKGGIRIVVWNGTYQKTSFHGFPSIMTFRQYAIDILPTVLHDEHTLSLQGLSVRELWRHMGKDGSNIYSQEFHKRILLSCVPLFYGLWVPFVFLRESFSRRVSFMPFVYGCVGVVFLQALLGAAFFLSLPILLFLAYITIFFPGVFWMRRDE